MIVVEERLTAAFEQLPQVAGGQPYFDFGNKEHLISLLKLFSDENRSPYPILYLMSNEDEQNCIGDEADHRIYLVIATRNIEMNMLNKNRWALSYRNVLFPVVGMVEKVFNRAGIFKWDGKYKLTKYPNYGSGEENFTTDIWDAVVVETDMKFLGLQHCIQTINFNF